jgi:pre-mRNA cleavage complex 2 protein Pcf11
MSTTQLSSEEIAEDYKSSLEDLAFNSRYEISNLTVIAKENIHAAQAIARAIEEHITKVSAPDSLPSYSMYNHSYVYIVVGVCGFS